MDTNRSMGSMADLLDISAAQQLWGERALATSRTQQTAFKEQWELIIENGKSQAIVLAELNNGLASLQKKVGVQQDELKGCASSVNRLDGLVTQHMQQKIEEVQADIEGSFALMEQKYKSEVQMLESHLMIMVENKFQQQQDLINAQSHEQDSLSRSDMWVGIKKEQYSHEVYIQDMLRRFSVSVKEQDARSNHIQDNLERVDEQMKWLMKEHDTGVVNGKEELQHFCSAIKAGLDARVTYLHEKVGELERSLEAHVDWVQAGRRDADIIGQIATIHDELSRLGRAVQAEQEAREVSIQKGCSQNIEELERQTRWMKDELQKLNVSVAARNGDDTRLQSMEERLDAHVCWAKAEIRQVDAQFEVSQLRAELQMQTARLDKDLDSLRTAIESECNSRCAGLRESVTHFQGELDKQSQWINGEVCKIDAAAKEQSLTDARHNDRCDRDLQAHISWVRKELQLLDAAVKTDLNTRLQRLEAASAEETTISASQLESRFEAKLNDLRQRLHNVDAMVKEHSAVEADMRERTTLLEGQLHDHAAWARGELRQVDTSLKSDHGVRLRRVEDQLDTHMGWVEGELRQLEIERQRLGDQLATHVDWAEKELSNARATAETHRLEHESGTRELAMRLDREFGTHRGMVRAELQEVVSRANAGQDVQAELRRLNTEVVGDRQARTGAEAIIHAEVKRLESKFGEERMARTEESREKTQRVEARLGELEEHISQLQDDLRGHSHSMSVTETIRCGPAGPSRQQAAAASIQPSEPVACEPVACEPVAREPVTCERVTHGQHTVSTPGSLTRSPPERWSPERTRGYRSRTTTNGTPARTSVALFQDNSLQQSTQTSVQSSVHASVERSSVHALQTSVHDLQSLLQT
mmetsp:Transcript_100341/g.199030  ORF Transcript_100341/g.199030 Transcript_100341/m.199030 type:complete len:873 (-) Transcript_100341:87-2705(-)